MIHHNTVYRIDDRGISKRSKNANKLYIQKHVYYCHLLVLKHSGT